MCCSKAFGLRRKRHEKSLQRRHRGGGGQRIDAFRASAKLDREQRPLAPTTPTPTSPLAPSAARPIIKSASHLIAHTPARARISPKVRARSTVAHKTHQSKSRSCARDNTQRAEPPDFFFPGLPRRRAATRTPSPSLKDAGPQQRQQRRYSRTISAESPRLVRNIYIPITNSFRH